MAVELSPPRYNRIEEWVNGLTHGIGSVLSITGLVLMVIFSSLYGDVWHIVSTAIYGATLILLYLSSTLYHLIPANSLKHFFQKMDHAMIYLLIAGTYTPYTLVNLRGPWGWTLFAMVWGIAVVGVTIEFLLKERVRFLSLILYLSMGWLMIAAAKPLLDKLAPGGLILLLAGGLFYSLGVFFYVWKTLTFQHAIWHVFVMAGSLCHFWSIFFYVIPSS